jgi:hypothetical protein
LDGEVNPAIRAAGHFGVVAAFGTFEKTGAAHSKRLVKVAHEKWWVGRDLNPGPTA